RHWLAGPQAVDGGAARTGEVGQLALDRLALVVVQGGEEAGEILLVTLEHALAHLPGCVAAALAATAPHHRRTTGAGALLRRCLARRLRGPAHFLLALARGGQVGLECRLLPGGQVHAGDERGQVLEHAGTSRALPGRSGRRLV